MRQSLKEVVEALGLGTVERKELTKDKVVETKNLKTQQTEKHTIYGTGE